MAKALNRKRVASEDYESDGGFVKDAPKSKKSKATSEVKASSFGEQKGDDGNDFWEISRTRRVQISDYQGKTMVNIREFYEKDGKTLPGKKGISLTIEQFNSVVELLPSIEGLLAKKGLIVIRPEYPHTKSRTDDTHGHSDADVPEESKNKANHEATSDEDED